MMEFSRDGKESTGRCGKSQPFQFLRLHMNPSAAKAILPTGCAQVTALIRFTRHDCFSINIPLSNTSPFPSIKLGKCSGLVDFSHPASHHPTWLISSGLSSTLCPYPNPVPLYTIHGEATMSYPNILTDEKSSDKNVGAEKGEPSANGSSDTEAASNDKDSSRVDGSHEPPVVPQVQNVFPEIPNGGLQAWLQVAGSFFLVFNTWYVHHTKLQILPQLTDIIGVSSIPLGSSNHITLYIYSPIIRHLKYLGLDPHKHFFSFYSASSQVHCSTVVTSITYYGSARFLRHLA